MNTWLTLILGLSRRWLALYPSRFRREYAEEFDTVFRLSLEEAAARGRLALACFCARELRDAPAALLRAHLREWNASREAAMTIRANRLENNNRTPKWIFYPGWVVLTVISTVLAGVVDMAILAQIVRVVGSRIEVGGVSHITEDFLALYVLLPTLGALTGFLQYLFLRRYLPRMGGWIAATFLGWLLFSAVLHLSRPFVNTWSPFLPFLLMGGPIGLFQWLLLRRRVSWAACWVVSSAIGWGMAMLPTDGAISSQYEILSVVLLPPIAGSIAWWLLLDKLPHRGSTGAHPPRSTSPESSAPLGEA